jgi:hypothetical protein
MENLVWSLLNTAVQEKGALLYEGYVTDTKIAIQAIMPEVYEPVPGETIPTPFTAAGSAGIPLGFLSPYRFAARGRGLPHGLQIVSQQFATPRFCDILQAVEELHRHVRGVGHLVDGIGVQDLVDLLLLLAGQGDQDSGRLAAARNCRASPRTNRSVGWLHMT